MKNFTVVMRAPSAVAFWQDEKLQVAGLSSQFGPLTAIYTTRWLKKAEEVVVPGQLWIEINGPGDSLENVLAPYANAALMVIPIMALSGNAAIGESQIEIGFESTPNIKERDYFQSYVPPESGAVHLGRHIDKNATIALMEALARNAEFERLLRACNQYRLALDAWKLGGESLSLAHLWMALEAMTKAAIRRECAKQECITEPELAQKLGIDLKQLDANIRKAFILQGDEECYKKAKSASDGLEHGYLGYDTIRSYAKDVRHRMATYIRRAILELSGVQSEVLSTLMTDPFDKPMGHWPVAKYLRGKLLGESEKLSQGENAYPFMRWNPSITSCKPDGVGKLTFQMSENITPELADGITFQPLSIEVWQPD